MAGGINFAGGSFDAATNTFTVTTADGLNAAIANLDAIGKGGNNNGLSFGAYTIKLAGNITLGGTAGGNYAAIGGTNAGQALTINSGSNTFTVAASNQLYALNLTTGANAASSVSVIIDGDNGVGGSYRLDGANIYNGFLVYNGQVAIQSLQIANAVAKGGDGDQGGGGAGLGGGLFIAGPNATSFGASTQTAGGNVTLTDVAFVANQAVGGNSTGNFGSAGGGGLLGGSPVVNSGGGIGAAPPNGNNGAVGLVLGAAPGASGGGNTGGAFGGGGADGGGGGVGAVDGVGGNGGFGGGGGVRDGGGFGGGGGALANGGFGGGGGGTGRSGGFGGGSGNGGSAGGSGGGGLGAGADVFVQQGGVLSIQGSSNLGAGTVTGGNGGIAGAAFGSGIFIQGNQSITLAPGAGNTTTVSGVIADQTGSQGQLIAGQGGGTGAGSLIIGNVSNPSGRVVLGPVDANGAAIANTFSGGATITAGATLAVAADAALGATSGNLILAGGTLETTAAGFNSSRSIALNTAGIVRVDTGTTTLSGVISDGGGGVGSLTKTGAGSLFLQGTNTYTGTTTVSEGFLRIANGGSILSSNIVITGGNLSLVGQVAPINTTILQTGGQYIAGQSQEIGSLSGSGGDGVIFGAVATLTTGRSNTNDTYGGVLGVGGNGALTKVGTGTFTLTGASTYTGATTINGGTLQLGSGSTTGSLSATTAISVGTNGILAVNHSDVLTLVNTLTGTGAFQQIGSGGTLLSGANSGYSGAVALDAGTLALNHRTGTTIDAAGTGTITFGAGAQTLRLNTAGSLANTIASFEASDTVDLRAITYSGATLSVAGNTVTVTESVANGGDVNVLNLGAAPSGFQFVLADDGSGAAALKLAALPPSQPTPSGPTAVNDTGSATFGRVLTATAPGVLANDSGSGGTLTVTAVNGQTANVGKAVLGTYGSLTLKGDGSYTYTPDATKTVFTTSVVDHFTYTDTANGQTATANLDITVSAPPASTLALFGTVVTSSATQTGSVYALYEGLLGRAPDALGLEGFSASLQAGAKLTDVAAAILNSAERGGLVSDPNAYVQALYTNTLHRAPDSAGQQFYVNELNSGVSQATVAVQFASSAEAAQVNAPAFSTGVFVTDAIDAAVARLYYGLLVRTPDSTGLNGFEMQVKQAAAAGGVNGAIQGLANVANVMLGSQEYGATHTGQSNAAFVDSLYLGALGRHADAGGSAFYTNELAQGVSQAQVALQISQSQEAQVHLVGQIELGWHII